jgi:PDZ domain-containing protein
VQIDGLPTYPTSGNLNMTTVSVTDRLTLFSALGFWASGDRQVVPRESLFPSNVPDQQIQDQNAAQFASSEANAESAALTELALPERVVVADLVPAAPASKILQVGDQLIAVAGKPVDSAAAVVAALAGTTPGQTVPITYRRGDQQSDVDVTLGSSPDRAQGLLGVVPGAIARDGDIKISLGGIGGPSAGLMFALSVVDKLTPGELTGGRFVAGTGAIGPAGDVQKIDGIPFKMEAAHDAGATVFLVPADNCQEAASTAPAGLQLIRVATLHDAVTALEALQAGRPVTSC